MRRKILAILFAVCVALTGPAAVLEAGEAASADADAVIGLDAGALAGEAASADAGTLAGEAASADADAVIGPDANALIGPNAGAVYVVNPLVPAGTRNVTEEGLAGEGDWSNQEMPSESIDNKEEVGETVRDFLLRRVSPFEIRMSVRVPYATYSQDIGDIVSFASESIENEALAHTGSPEEGDYLSFQYGGYSPAMDYDLSVSDNMLIGTLFLRYNFDLYTTAEQEQKVTEGLGEVMADLELDGKSDYEKVKAIHDYICKNVSYDYEHLGNPSYKTQYTAYGALIDHKAVCQGYAMLFYRMCLEAGIDARIISGIADNGDDTGAHAWNIVRLGGKYYYVDVTWDDPTFEGNPDYYCHNYFLVGARKMGLNHVADDEFLSYAFTSAYPISDEDYERSYYDDYSDDEPSFVKKSLILGGQLGLNFYLKLPEIANCDYNDSYMEFIINDDTANAKIVPFDPEHRNSDGRLYGFTARVSSVEMADLITAIFHYTVNGTEATLWCEYTVEQYLYELVALGAVGALLDLTQAINDYGYYAQQFLSAYAKKPWTLGTDHEAMTTHYKDSYSLNQNDLAEFAVQKNLQDADIASVSLSLTLDTDTAINLYLRPKEDYSGTVSAKIFFPVEKIEKPLEVTELYDGRFKLRISGIAAHNLGQMYHVTVTTASGDSTINVSTLSYACTCMDPEDPARNLMCALYDYFVKADAYKKTLENQEA